MTRILIVEDDVDIQSTLKEVLENEGYEVTQATDGLQALDVIHGMKDSPRPDLIVLDLMMPTFDGWSFLCAKNGDSEVKGIPVIVMTAMNCHEARRRQLEGVGLIIHKPYDLDILLSAVDRITHPRPTNRPPPPAE